MTKIAKCKHIPTLEEVMARPEPTAPMMKSVRDGRRGGDPLSAILESRPPAPQMGRGVDPHSVVADEWEIYDALYGGRRRAGTITKLFKSDSQDKLTKGAK